VLDRASKRQRPSNWRARCCETVAGMLVGAFAACGDSGMVALVAADVSASKQGERRNKTRPSEKKKKRRCRPIKVLSRLR
jgi:hypothetical protein